MLIGICICSIAELFSNTEPAALGKLAPVVLVLVMIAQPVYRQKPYLFQMTPEQVTRTIYSGNPFSESLKIADYIKQNSTLDDTIAILGSESQICFYSNRRSATSHTSIYPIVAVHKYARQMQEEVIKDIETAQPKFIVFVRTSTSWAMSPNSEKLIFEWFAQYQKNYHTVGFADIVARDRTIYRWDRDAENYKPTSSSWVAVLQRNDI